MDTRPLSPIFRKGLGTRLATYGLVLFPDPQQDPQGGGSGEYSLNCSTKVKPLKLLAGLQ